MLLDRLNKTSWVFAAFKCSDKWYTHKLQSVKENDEYKILWTFNIQTDKIKEHGQPDLNKQKRERQITDCVIPVDQNIAIKEQEKIDKYQNLRKKLQKVWNVKEVVIPVVIGALGTISKKIHHYIKRDLTSQQT